MGLISSAKRLAGINPTVNNTRRSIDFMVIAFSWEMIFRRGHCSGFEHERQEKFLLFLNKLLDRVDFL
jgi:hypothetical protein